MEEDSIELKRNVSEHQLPILDSGLAKHRKSTALAYVLWFFLGGLGIHKFYIGKTGMGVFYLLLLGGLIVGTITGRSQATEPAMIVAGSCGIILGISLLVDLFTIPRQIRRANIQAEREKYRAKIQIKAGRKRRAYLPLILIILFVLGVIGYFAMRTPSPRKPPSPWPVVKSILDKMHIKLFPKKPSRFVYARTTCNIRSGPGTNYPVIRKAANGETLEYVSLEGNWYRLKVPQDKPQEWIHKSVVRPLVFEPEPPQLPQGIKQIMVRGKRIEVGDLADDVMKILKPEDTLKLEVVQDPNNPQGLVLTRYCRVKGKVFALKLRREKDPGPYRVEKIIFGKLPPGSSVRRKIINK